MPACPAIPQRRGWRGSTGRCLTTRAPSSSSLAPTTRCKACRPRAPRRRLRQDHRDGAGAGTADPARRHGGAAQHGQGLCRGVPRDLSRSRGALRTSSSIRSFSRARRSTTSMMQADGLHPNAKGVAAIVENILPKVEELLARVKSQGIAGLRARAEPAKALQQQRLTLRAGSRFGHHLRPQAAIPKVAPPSRREFGEARGSPPMT